MCKPNCLLRKMGPMCWGIFHFLITINMSLLIKTAFDILHLHAVVG